MFMSDPGNVPAMTIEEVRAEISDVDRRIIRLIARRQKLAGRIAQIKVARNLPIHDGDRATDVLESAFEQAVECRIDPVSVREIFGILIAMSEDRQRECSGDGNLP